MKCSRCGQPLLSVLEQTRGICATCHLFPESRGIVGVSEGEASVPTELQPGTPAGPETTAGESEAPGVDAPAPAVAPELDGNDVGPDGMREWSE